MSNLVTTHLNVIEEELLILHRGQGRELLWRDNIQCPTEDEYLAMVKESEYLAPIVCASDPDCSTETGGLLRIAIRLMMECATTNMDVLVRQITPPCPY